MFYRFFLPIVRHDYRRKREIIALRYLIFQLLSIICQFKARAYFLEKKMTDVEQNIPLDNLNNRRRRFEALFHSVSFIHITIYLIRSILRAIVIFMRQKYKKDTVGCFLLAVAITFFLINNSVIFLFFWF